jgi:hypothetical protein
MSLPFIVNKISEKGQTRFFHVTCTNCTNVPSALGCFVKGFRHLFFCLMQIRGRTLIYYCGAGCGGEWKTKDSGVVRSAARVGGILAPDLAALNESMRKSNVPTVAPAATRAD